MLSPSSLQQLTGQLEVKFKGGAFSTWSDSFVRIQGRWLCVYKHERDSVRQGAIELGMGVTVTDMANSEAYAKFQRHFHLTCNGGLLPRMEVKFRAKTREDRDLWVQAIATNLQCLTSSKGMDPFYGVEEMTIFSDNILEDIMLHPIRIRSDMTIKCATGETIVSALLKHNLVSDRVTGTIFCRQLLSMNLLHHVMWDRDFTDSPEPFVIAAYDVENDRRSEKESDYHVTHFSKYMDSRKFWRYIAESDVKNKITSSGGIRRAVLSSSSVSRSASSSSTGCTPSISVGSEQETWRILTNRSSTGSTQPSYAGPEKKARKCAVCAKSFNPLRRRYFCHHCCNVVCSNCSVIPVKDSGESAGKAVPSWQICISCKLISNATFMGEPDDLMDGKIQLQTSQSASDVLTSTSSTSEFSRSNVAEFSSQGTSVCHHCQNEKCSPITDFLQIKYPVNFPIDVGFVTAEQFTNEAVRLESVKALLVTMASTPSVTRVLRQFCNMAAIASQCPIAIVGFLEEDKYVLGSQYGINSEAAVPRSHAIAAHTCRSGEPLVCSDMALDVRFKGNTWRQESLKCARLYVGIPLILSDGCVVGALEVFDLQPRYECGEMLGRLQTVVRGLLNLLEKIMTATAEAHKEEVEEQFNEALTEYQTEQPNIQNQEKEQSTAVNPMEAQLLELLSQTTTTQEQLRAQQGQMVSAISSHSKQIDNLTKQLERIEATLATKLDGKRGDKD
ncbi:hypothetical protein L914_21223 [Plasmopara halstedii]|uniref:FYVE-type domain-containing protein n=1 Tax=Plasmopara halstedii TaxID=4781 RepID=A0A0P1A6W3_PLAHL|nr:hypothetical protein L914_21223 [Plasmopara halstedii]CEG36378.1 hypothetical protein L914_21223 [Plasmopara halstedii]|eukprot:XP_024572747.1 hypothetical protein L914_21223 [Plasmopara halstedii]